jgi:hypothetical protein
MATINLAWTNPTAAYFTEVELYRSESNIINSDRTFCAANATLIYSGTNESYADTGRAAGTTYYYRIFVKYTISGIDYYSNGVGRAENTTENPYQEWDGYPDTPELYVYQAIVKKYEGEMLQSTELLLSDTPMYVGGGSRLFNVSGSIIKYQYSLGEWINRTITGNWRFSEIVEANHDIYTDYTLTVVYFTANA